MSIYSGSRYQGGEYTTIKTSDGKIKKYLHPRAPYSKVYFNGGTIVPYGGEALDELAVKNGFKETDWYIFAELNDIDFALDILPNRNIILPR